MASVAILLQMPFVDRDAEVKKPEFSEATFGDYFCRSNWNGTIHGLPPPRPYIAGC